MPIQSTHTITLPRSTPHFNSIALKHTESVWIFLLGNVVRFEPGNTKVVSLVEIGGAKIVSGGNRLASVPRDLYRTDEIVKGLALDTHQSPVQ